MRLLFTLLIAFFLINNFAYADHKTNHSKFSSETKGIITGGSVTGLGVITLGISVAGVTALFPLTVVGSTIGYISVKANKKFKRYKNKAPKRNVKNKK